MQPDWMLGKSKNWNNRFHDLGHFPAFQIPVISDGSSPKTTLGTAMNALLSPKNDYVFKKLFTSDAEILKT